MASSTKLNKYGNELGTGRAVAFRSGYADEFDGNVSRYRRREGGDVRRLTTLVELLEDQLAYGKGKVKEIGVCFFKVKKNCTTF
ncbi:hypothetical protein TIFTF001_007058 [Ficus carica]|uniref:Uncharacterized protein n=1 Tax=Ficus carica TaxID=3494 RepID=A0AA87ZP81_FICCA|nr:hypothetical protein TIFTF001_007058 [Ficus carica]